MIRYDRNHLPEGEWGAYRKHSETPMVPVAGPFRVVTQEGAYDLPGGWQGAIAVDRAGYPYPIEAGERDRTYTLCRRITGPEALLDPEVLIDPARLAARLPKDAPS